MQYLSPILAQASGSVGGVVASHNQYVKYFRARTTPTDPKSPRQRQIRNYFGQCSNAWLNILDADDRARWETYAANVPMKNALGHDVHYTGRQHFFRSWLGLVSPGDLMLFNTIAPDVFALPAFDLVSPVPATFINSVRIYFNDQEPWCTEYGARLLCYMSTQQQNTVNFWKGPYTHYKTIYGHGISPPTSPVDVSMPFILTVGRRIFFRARLSRADLRLSHSQYTSALVVTIG